MKCRLTSNIVEVVSEALGEHVVAAIVVDSQGRGSHSTAFLLRLAAGLGDLARGKTPSGAVLPLLPAVDSAAVEGPLDSVPGDGDTLVVLSSVVLHSFLHVGLDGGVQVSLHMESSNAGTNLEEELLEKAGLQ